MPKSWQRRVIDEPKVDDLTTLEVGTDCVWEVRPVIACPSCGRAGVKNHVSRPEGPSYDIVVHLVDDMGLYRDYCVEADFVASAPTMLVLNPDGSLKKEVFPTGTKAGTGEGGSKN